MFIIKLRTLFQTLDRISAHQCPWMTLPKAVKLKIFQNRFSAMKSTDQLTKWSRILHFLNIQLLNRRFGRERKTHGKNLFSTLSTQSWLRERSILLWKLRSTTVLSLISYLCTAKLKIWNWSRRLNRVLHFCLTFYTPAQSPTRFPRSTLIPNVLICFNIWKNTTFWM